MLIGTRMRDERGATALFLATAMVLLLGMAAIAIDVGSGFNERRQNQSAADVAALAGALENIGDDAAVRDAVFELVADNVTQTYSAAEWQTQWETCTDSERATFNASGFLFTPIDALPGWSVSSIDCVSVDPRGYVRVRVPDQLVETTFGSILGISEFVTHADAIAKTFARGVGGVLPFGISAGQHAGEQGCLSSGPTGLADDPCEGSDSGNFGTIKARIFGDPEAGIDPNCQASPLGQTLAQNIAAGVDHPLYPHRSPIDTAVEVRDECSLNPVASFNEGVDTLNTDTGFPNNGAEQGLATGPVPYGLTPRLQLPHTDAGKAPAATRPKTATVNTYELDDTPLWYFLRSDLVADTDPGRDGSDPLNSVPPSCLRSSFLTPNVSMDWDMGGADDPPRDYNDIPPEDAPYEESWQHMAACFAQYLGDLDLDGTPDAGITPYTDTVLFESGINEADTRYYGLVDSPRFAYVPRFHEGALGDDRWLHIADFQPIFLQGTWWQRNNAGSYLVFHPGEDCQPVDCDSVSGYSMTQLSAFIIPDDALPLPLRGDPLPGGELSPYDVELYR